MKQKTPTHELNKEGTACKHCGVIVAHWDEECEEEDLSMWCAPGQSVKQMLEQAAEKD